MSVKTSSSRMGWGNGEANLWRKANGGWTLFFFLPFPFSSPKSQMAVAAGSVACCAPAAENSSHRCPGGGRGTGSSQAKASRQEGDKKVISTLHPPKIAFKFKFKF